MALAPPERITCVDCGGTCHRLTGDPELGWQLGDLVTYRCADCNDRWELEVDESDDDDAAGGDTPSGSF